jgi:hypothetical protein
MGKLNNAFLAMAAVAAGPQAWGLEVHQDQGVLNISYANLSKPYEYRMTVPKGCLAGSVKVEAADDRLSIKHTANCGSGATVELTLRKDVSVIAELQAGSLRLVNFSSYQNYLGSVSLGSEVGTVNVPLGLGFKESGETLVGRSYERLGSASGPNVTAKVKYGEAAVR